MGVCIFNCKKKNESFCLFNCKKKEAASQAEDLYYKEKMEADQAKQELIDVISKTVLVIIIVVVVVVLFTKFKPNIKIV